MTPATPPVLYISADTSDLTTRFKATPRMHTGAEVWIPRDAVRVKPLEWGPWEHGNAIAKSIFGVYCIWDGYWRPPGQQGGIPSPDPQSAAQADYEARIMSALAALPAPDEGEQGGEA